MFARKLIYIGIITFSLVPLSYTNGYSQNSVVQYKVDSIKAESLIDSALIFFDSDKDLAFDLSERALELNLATCNLSSLPYLYQMLTVLSCETGRYAQALQYIEDSKKFNWVYKYSFPSAYESILHNTLSVKAEILNDWKSITALDSLSNAPTAQLLDSFTLGNSFRNLSVSYFEHGALSNAVRNARICLTTTNSDVHQTKCQEIENLVKLSIKNSPIRDIHAEYLNCVLQSDNKLCQYYLILKSRKLLMKGKPKESLRTLNKIDSSIISNTTKFKLLLLRYELNSKIGLDNSQTSRALKSKLDNGLRSAKVHQVDYKILQIKSKIDNLEYEQAKTLIEQAKSLLDSNDLTISNRGIPRVIPLYFLDACNSIQQEEDCAYTTNKLNSFLSISRKWSNSFTDFYSSLNAQKVFNEYLITILSLMKNTKQRNCDSTIICIIKMIDLSKSFDLSRNLNSLLLVRNISQKTKHRYLKLLSELKHLNSLENFSDNYFQKVDSTNKIIEEYTSLYNEATFEQPQNNNPTLHLYCYDSIYFSYFQYLSKFHIATDKINNLTPSHDLYSQIFPPDIDWSKYDHLTIVPDGEFHNFSFESLLTSDEPYDHPRDAPYLFKKIPISYSLGLHLGRDYSEFDDTGLRSASFAPEFKNDVPAATRDCQEDRYGQLLCNQDEARIVSDATNGQSFLGQQATKENFIQSIDDYNFFHLATHACIDTNNYYESSLIFQDGPLPMSELYETDWNNKTVVLSACNTAQGAVVSGEGVFNFARTLTELGCKEVIVSLWPIDDCSTKEFISIFYDFIQEGYKTAEALQKTRLSYLETADKLHADPYFWAPLVLISNDINIGKKEKSNVALWIAMGIVGTLLLGMGIRNKAQAA